MLMIYSDCVKRMRRLGKRGTMHGVSAQSGSVGAYLTMFDILGTILLHFWPVILFFDDRAQRVLSYVATQDHQAVMSIK